MHLQHRPQPARQQKERQTVTQGQQAQVTPEIPPVKQKGSGCKAGHQQGKAVGKTGSRLQQRRQPPMPTSGYGALPGKQGQHREQHAIAVGKFAGQGGEQIAAPDRILFMQQKSQAGQHTPDSHRACQTQPVHTAQPDRTGQQHGCGKHADFHGRCKRHQGSQPGDTDERQRKVVRQKRETGKNLGHPGGDVPMGQQFVRVEPGVEQV
ncbi:hypothetical protein GALL_489880 [mine drainage metagenome]|uniref:Uncharacterized protein n=1 Tax=mine drainage metagenome TaxID=410659 RepID=A0A1J5Q0M9_9ZZZZ